MKNKMNIARKLIVFATLFLISCSEDLYENGNSHNNEDIKISKVSLKESRFQNKPKLIQEVNKVKSKQNSTSTTGRMVYDSINNFYFDDENGMLVETSSGYESYTFKVEREVPTNYELENIVFSKNGNEYDVTIVKYELTTSEIEQLEDNILFEPTVEPEIEVISRVMDCNTKIDKCTIIISPSSGEIIGYEITYLDPCEGSSGGSNTGSGSGTGTGDSGSGTGSGTGGLDPIGSGTGTSWEGGGSNTNGGLITTPTGGGGGGSSTSLNMDNFLLGLSFQGQEWYDNQSTETQQSIFNYLNTNGFNTTNKNKIKNLIQVVSQTNGTFVLSPNVNSGNSQVFNNSQELTNYLNSITDSQNSTTEFTSLFQNQKIAKFNKTVNFFTDFSVQVSQSISPYVIQSVASSISGNTFSITYTQTTPNNGADISTNNNIVTVQFYGNLDINIFFEGIGVIHTYEITQIVKINKLTGEPIPGSYQILGLP